MKKLIVVLLWLAVLGIIFNLQAAPDPSGVQYYWATQNKVYLWITPDDVSPVVATFDPDNKLWNIGAVISDERWKAVLKKAAQAYSPETDISQLENEKLWAFVLTKLRNDFDRASWATHRTPSAEIYIRKPNAQTIELISLYKDNQGLKRMIYKFSRRQNGTWRKESNIDLNATIGVSESSDELRKVLDIPKEAALPKDATSWNAVWIGFLDKLLNNTEADRPVIFRDKNDALQLLWRERLSPNVDIPVATRKATLKPPVIEESSSTATTQTVIDGKEYPSWLRPVSILIAIIGAVGILLFILRKRLPKLIDYLGSKLAARIRPAQPSKNVLVSPDGLALLHRLLKERYQKQPYSENESARNFLLNSVDWVQQEYLSLMSSPEFLKESNDLKAKIINDYQQELGIAPSDAEKAKRWIELGQTTDKSAPKIAQVKAFPSVKEAIKEKQAQFESDAGWLERWPDVVCALDTLTTKYKQDCQNLTEQLAGKDSLHEKELQEKTKVIKDSYEGQLGGLRSSLAAKTSEHHTTSQQLITAQEQAAALQREVNTLRQQLDDTKDFGRKAKEMQEVRNLSRYLRQWVQGHFIKQQTKDWESSVGLIAALINFSLYQMCFSIVEGKQPLTRAMAQNLFSCAKIFNQSTNFEDAYKILSVIDPKIEAGINDLARTGGGTLDDRLLQAFLSKLKTEGVNLGPFYIDLDAQNKIITVSAS